MYESHPRQLIFLRKSDCLGCVVLLCLVVCLTLLASFFLPSHLSLTCVASFLHEKFPLALLCIYLYVLDVDCYEKKPAWTGITAQADLGGVIVQREKK